MNRFLLLLFGALGFACQAAASFLANDDFSEPPVLAAGQTAVGIGQEKKIHPSSANSIQGLEGWKHAPTLNAGLGRTTPVGTPYLFVQDSNRAISQESVIPIQAGQTWRVNAHCKIPGTDAVKQAATVELWAGAISTVNPEAMQVGSALLKSFVVGSSDWGGFADARIASGGELFFTFSYTIPAGSPQIGKHLVVRIVTIENDVSFQWFEAKLRLLPIPPAGGVLALLSGNGGAKISGIVPTGPGSSNWTQPAPWEASTQSLRLSDVYATTWAMLPQYMTGEGNGLDAGTSATLTWDVYPRSVFGIGYPTAAIVTANGTYYSFTYSLIPNSWNRFDIPLKAKYWLKNHYLFGSQEPQSQFAYDLLSTQSVHLNAAFGGSSTDTNIRSVQFGGGIIGGLTVNCTVVPDGFTGTFSPIVGLGRQAKVIQYDQGVQVGVATIEGGLNEPGGIKITGGVPGTYRVYSEGDRFLRTDCGTITFPSTALGSVIGTIQLRNGDCDNDGVVSIFDYIVLSDSFDAAPGNANWDPRADLDGDAVVSIFDYIILSDRFDASDQD